MAYTSGFFNSHDHDRMYDADDIGAMFDGIITDGILSEWGAHFLVRYSGTDTGSSYVYGPREVRVFSGKAWYLHSWIRNLGPVSLTAESNTSSRDRIDTVILKIDTTDATRANTIAIKKGGTSAPPMVEDGGYKEVPLADITIDATSNSITNIVDRRGDHYARCTLAIPYYPVGSIYISVNNDEPSGLFGGTWEQISGRFLIGCGGNSGFEENEQGGDWNHTLNVSQLPAHNHSLNNIATTSEGANVHLRNDNSSPSEADTGVIGWPDPNASSSNNINQNYTPADWNFPYGYNGSQTPNPSEGLNVAPSKYIVNHSTLNDYGHLHYVNGTTESTGSTQPITVKPPYLAVYMWKRIS